ncbi:thiol-disulfide oxidoreductase LTO1-like [Miscanthus floridulus]|uniref:thiol-disulfide oxidoreductase LTO1-like n=1 Tax=Miscanthus floridulus TaxID=154761 RepID=UPI00345ACD46
MATISAALAISFFPSPTRFAVATTFSASSRIKRAARFRCCAESSSQEQETSAAPPTPPPEKPARSPPSSLLGISTSTWSAGVAGLGFLETGYLTYLKLTGSEAFCPITGAGCGDVLDSDYSVVFGIPLPLFGLVTYGLVTALSLQENGKDLLPGSDDLDIRLILLLTATSMATASAYFLYILSTKFVGVSCSYCLLSAFLSFTLLFIRVKDFGFERIQKFAGIQLAVAVIIALALTNSYSSATTQLKGTDDFVLEPYETEITTESSPFAIALARHLHSIGAKMYGAFWCSHCNEQKQLFGREATKILDYVECFPNGAGKGKKMTAECAASGLEGFPTWFINGKVLSGDQELEVLAEASGFVAEGTEQSTEILPN